MLGFIDREMTVDILFAPTAPENSKKAARRKSDFMGLRLDTTLKMRNKIVTHFSDPFYLKDENILRVA